MLTISTKKLFIAASQLLVDNVEVVNVEELDDYLSVFIDDPDDDFSIDYDGVDDIHAEDYDNSIEIGSDEIAPIAFTFGEVVDILNACVNAKYNSISELNRKDLDADSRSTVRTLLSTFENLENRLKKFLNQYGEKIS